MLHALIIDSEQKSIDALVNLLTDLCPSIKLCGSTQSLQDIRHKLSIANVVFLNTNFLKMKESVIYLNSEKQIAR